MKNTTSAIEFTSEFSVMATIKKISTFDSKGGGLIIQCETAEMDKAIDLLTAKGNVCQFDIKVSKQKSLEVGEESEQLDFPEIIEE